MKRLVDTHARAVKHAGQLRLTPSRHNEGRGGPSSRFMLAFRVSSSSSSFAGQLNLFRAMRAKTLNGA
jgi:hypothetical protein